MIFILMRWPAAWLCIPLSKWRFREIASHTPFSLSSCSP